MAAGINEMEPSKKKILIIDDEIDIVNILDDLFKARGFEVAKAIRGSMGLDLAFKMKPDLVILDLRMPGLDGESALKELKERLPETKVLIFTAWTGTETKNRVLAKGADMFVEKPGDFEDLKDRVIHLLERT